jgi:hypothetical protein
MSMVQQTPDGHLIVRSGSDVYIDTYANATRDFGVATPALPSGCIDLVYEPGVRNVGTDGFTVVYAGPVPWTLGDNYITNITAALASQAANPPPPMPPPTRSAQNAQLVTEASPNDGSSSP